MVSIPVGVGVGVVQITHPDWLGNHSWILPACALWIAMSILLWLVQFRWFQRILGIGKEGLQDAVPSPATANATASAYAPATANATSPVSITNNFAGIAPPSSPISPPYVPIEDINLEMVFYWKPLLYSLVGGRWISSKDDPNAKQGLVFLVTYPVPGKGSLQIPSLTLSAHLRFYFSNMPSFSEQVSRAYWLDQSENTVTLEVGHQAAIVVAVIEDDGIRGYENPYPEPVGSRWGSSMRELGPQKADLSGIGYMKI